MGNPLLNMLGNGQPNNNGSLLTQLIGMARKNDKSSMEKILSDIFAKNGRDFHTEFNDFMSKVRR